MHKSLVLGNIKDMHFEVCNVCNLSCIYCSAYEQATEKPPFMSLEIAHKYIDMVFEKTCAEVVDLMFYGGEAMLQSVAWFNKIINYAERRSLELGKTVRFLMQSNATLLDEERIDLIERFNIVTGTSLDGPPNIHQKTRGNFDSVMKSILRLKEVGCFGGVICTISDVNYDKTEKILEYFEQQQIFWVAFNVIYCIGRGRDQVPLKAEKIFSAHKGIVSYLQRTKGKRVVEGNVAEKLERYIYPLRLEDVKQHLMCNKPFCGGCLTAILCDSKGDLLRSDGNSGHQTFHAASNPA